MDSPFAVLCSPLDPDGVGEDGAEFALCGDVDWLGRAFRLDARLVCGDGVGQLHHFPIHMDIQVGRKLVGRLWDLPCGKLG